MDARLQHQLDHWNDAYEIVRTEYAYLPVIPEPKQSVRVAGGEFLTDPKKRAFVKRLCDELERSWSAAPMTQAVRLTALFCFPWRVKDSRVRLSLEWALMDRRPDVDNLLKPLADSLVGCCLSDDGRIVEVRARKIRFEIPGIALRLDAVYPLSAKKDRVENPANCGTSSEV